MKKNTCAKAGTLKSEMEKQLSLYGGPNFAQKDRIQIGAVSRSHHLFAG